MKLNNRLEKIASLVSNNATLVDIGCDHGYLCINLALNNKIKHAYASDINQGPLDNVKTNTLNANVQDKITCLLSNGLDEYENIQFTDLVVAGMGGSLIVDILAKHQNLLDDKTLILAPNINSFGLRTWLINNNYNITEEALVEDTKIIYQIIKAQKDKPVNYSKLELMYGKNQKDIELLTKLMKQDLNKTNDILKRIPENNTNYNEFNEKKLLIEGYLYDLSPDN